MLGGVSFLLPVGMLGLNIQILKQSMPKDLCADYVAAWNCAQVTTIKRLLSSDATYVDVPSGQSVSGEAVAQFFESNFKVYRDCQLSIIEEIWSDSGVLTLRWQVKHKQKNTGEVEGVDIVRFGGQSIEEVFSYYDIEQERKVTGFEFHNAQLDAPSDSHAEKYKRSGLSARMQMYIATQVEQLLETEQLFLQPDLKLKHLSEQLGFTLNHISQAINSSLQLNFHQLLNRYRVHYAKQLLAAGQPGSVLDVAMESGFNSSSGFYKVFKEYVGVSPAEYRQSLHEKP